MNKDYYNKYQQFINELTNKEKKIKKSFELYKKEIGNNTEDIENQLRDDLKNFKELAEKLNEAYKINKISVPLPEHISAERRVEIGKFLQSYNELNTNFNNLSSDKHSFNDHIDINNRNYEEYKDKESGELVNIANEKIKKQDEQINNMKIKVKEGRKDLREFQDNLNEDKVLIGQGITSIETADSKIIKLNNRLLKYLANSSNWCLRIFLIAEIVIAIVLIIVFTKV